MYVLCKTLWEARTEEKMWSEYESKQELIVGILFIIQSFFYRKLPIFVIATLNIDISFDLRYYLVLY